MREALGATRRVLKAHASKDSCGLELGVAGVVGGEEACVGRERCAGPVFIFVLSVDLFELTNFEQTTSPQIVQTTQ